MHHMCPAALSRRPTLSTPRTFVHTHPCWAPADLAHAVFAGNQLVCSAECPIDEIFTELQLIVLPEEDDPSKLPDKEEERKSKEDYWPGSDGLTQKMIPMANEIENTQQQQQSHDTPPTTAVSRLMTKCVSFLFDLRGACCVRLDHGFHRAPVYLAICRGRCESYDRPTFGSTPHTTFERLGYAMTDASLDFETRLQATRVHRICR